MNEKILPRVVGGIGKKTSNNGTQWYQQDRIYSCDIAIAITTTNPPYYAIPKGEIINDNKQL